MADTTGPARPSALSAYLRLLPVVLAEFRTTGPFYVFFSVLLPAGILFFVNTSGGDVDLRYLAGGALAASLAMGPAVMLCARLGLAREHHEFDYWATLPVPKVSLVLALCTGHLLFSLPGVAAMLALGWFLLGIPGTGVLAALPLVPLAALTLAGLGAFLGSRAPNSIVGNLIGNLVLAVALFLSPLMTRLDAYPALLKPVAYAIPTTYVADAFRHVFHAGPVLVPFWVDLAVMGGLTAALLVLTHRLLDWRGR
ncbi:ABC transporter permease [Catellatospora tritici]|uniref:ABC transporter permease n=1 Tax=Catellatospora tritici TaxID=2851566 RepID=UPI001C2D67D4|nr:ABC transporter permease [Catellatospora tritici]MBV1850755.1 ABC transporter permease [Catellatospora tritici]MBV1851008.1 ABC transporter permease [Catellatospora tritici]